MNDEQNHVVEILNEAMSKLKNIVDIDTVMGEPVQMPDGGVIIPITNVAMGFVAGGGEYSGNTKNKHINFPFSGGSGAGFSIKPVGFLVGKNGNYELISITDEPAYKKLAEIVADLTKTFIKQKTAPATPQENGEKKDEEQN